MYVADCSTKYGHRTNNYDPVAYNIILKHGLSLKLTCHAFFALALCHKYAHKRGWTVSLFWRRVTVRRGVVSTGRGVKGSTSSGVGGHTSLEEGAF